MRLITALLNDEFGFIISAELVLIATIAVLGMIVGFSQVQNSVVSELNDVAHAIGSLNQSYYYSGFHARKWAGWTKSRTVGSFFFDFADACDAWGCQISCDGAVAECGWGGCAAGCDGGGYSTGYSTGTAVNRTVTPSCAPATCAPVSCAPVMSAPVMSSPSAHCAPLAAP
ncbi:hypothetical protein [Planctomicrobium piriforme]|uniref:Branched-chain amino acid aminotransferase n=1 Tax=Planctomicrobium piriforme TaxID=1576369 RepID=A0A1I3R2J6_9PLAN|nr:hypothetical protein [Planctomicrobium piriforme]SFJ39466.1 hypothetical protein SAMN05421753_119110 [Planctomicrobium piriforme]